MAKKTVKSSVKKTRKVTAKSKKRKIVKVEKEPTFSEWFFDLMKDVFIGNAPVLVRKKAIEIKRGDFDKDTNQISSKSKREITARIKKILDEAENIKIGISRNIDDRMKWNEYRRSYSYFEKILVTRHKDVAREAEEFFIKKFQKSHPNQVDNLSIKKAGRLSRYKNRYYIYVVYNKKTVK